MAEVFERSLLLADCAACRILQPRSTRRSRYITLLEPEKSKVLAVRCFGHIQPVDLSVWLVFPLRLALGMLSSTVFPCLPCSNAGVYWHYHSGSQFYWWGWLPITAWLPWTIRLFSCLLFCKTLRFLVSLCLLNDSFQCASNVVVPMSFFQCRLFQNRSLHCRSFHCRLFQCRLFKCLWKKSFAKRQRLQTELFTSTLGFIC